MSHKGCLLFFDKIYTVVVLCIGGIFLKKSDFRKNVVVHKKENKQQSQTNDFLNSNTYSEQSENLFPRKSEMFFRFFSVYLYSDKYLKILC